jgi:hypothetical protein
MHTLWQRLFKLLGRNLLHRLGNDALARGMTLPSAAKARLTSLSP